MLRTPLLWGTILPQTQGRGSPFGPHSCAFFSEGTLKTKDRPGPEACQAVFSSGICTARMNEFSSFRRYRKGPQRPQVGYLHSKLRRKQKLWLGKDSGPLSEHEEWSRGAASETSGGCSGPGASHVGLSHKPFWGRVGGTSPLSFCPTQLLLRP